MDIGDKTKNTSKKLETIMFLFIIIFFLLPSIYISWKEKFELFVIFLIFFNLFILPAVPPSFYYWWKTRHIRNLDPLNMKNSDAYKIFEMKEDSKTLVKRFLYIHTLERNFMICYIANFYLIFFILLLVLMLTIPTFAEISLVYWIVFLISFLILYLLLILISSISKKESGGFFAIYKSLRDSIYYFLDMILLIICSIIIGYLITVIILKGEWQFFFTPNVLFSGKYLTLAGIIFTFVAIFMSSILIGGYKNFLGAKSRLERELKTYKTELKNKYEQFSDNIIDLSGRRLS